MGIDFPDTELKRQICVDKRTWRPSPFPGQVVLVTTTDETGQPWVATKSLVSMAALGPPPVLMFGCSSLHATARNIERRGEFVVNVPGESLTAACWAIGSNPEVRGAERFARAGLKTMPSLRVAAPRIAECHAHLECELDGLRSWGQEVAIFGRIVAASMDERVLEAPAGTCYRELSPFFFLESGRTAPLGEARAVVDGPLPPRLILTVLAVTDLERSKRFYDDAFGWEKRVDLPVFVEYALPDGRGLGLYHREAFARNTGQLPQSTSPGALTTSELYFHCHDPQAAAARLGAAGARRLSELSLRDWGDEAAYFADPDGNTLVVARRA